MTNLEQNLKEIIENIKAINKAHRLIEYAIGIRSNDNSYKAKKYRKIRNKKNRVAKNSRKINRK